MKTTDNQRLFDDLSEATLAIAQYCDKIDLQEVFSHVPIDVYARLDQSHAQRLPGDYCPFACEVCEILKRREVYPRLVIRG